MENNSLNINNLKTIFSCIDSTTLEGADTHQRVKDLCMNSVDWQTDTIPHVASVCVYPVFVKEACNYLKGSGIKVASVAGAFPAGQSPLNVKLAEVQYALNEGADEIDMVISRGKLIDGEYDIVVEEIKSIKEVCGNHVLKVILETGELPSGELVAKASELAIEGGADFLKTSTGKIAVGATLESSKIMLTIIKNYYQKTGKLVGFKAAGGISTPEQALEYYELAQNTLGSNFVNNQYFRIGASRLTKKLFSILTF